MLFLKASEAVYLPMHGIAHSLVFLKLLHGCLEFLRRLNDSPLVAFTTRQLVRDLITGLEA
jgi:hypothetical protein